MPHRAKQIIDAVAAALAANQNLGAKVEVNRVRSISEAADELPAFLVNFGSDTADDSSDMQSFRSSLEVVLTAYCMGDNEADVLSQLLELRRQSHIAMMDDMTFGLSFVWDTAYGGADPPVIQRSERAIGALTSRWFVRYILNFSDPG